MVVKVLKELRTGKEIEFNMPKICPYCGTRLIKQRGEVIWRCPNFKCEHRQKKYLSYFVSRQGFNIEEQLFEKRFISDPADIFNLQEKDILTLEGFAEKAVKNLIESIKAKKEISFSKFIYALGIDQVGEETAQDLASCFKDLGKIRKASLEQLIDIKDIGPETAESIYNWRERAKERIKELGGRVLENINKNTDFLILGKNPGSKLEKAKKLNIEIINEKEFLSLITIH